MKILSPLFGFLGKATSARSNTPEEGDTKLEMPGVISNILEAPFPIFQVYSLPLPIPSAVGLVTSFIYSEQAQFNANTTVDTCSLGPGVWKITFSISLEEQGAVSDPTSIHRVLLYPTDGVGASVDLGRVTNKQGLDQSVSYSWIQTVMTEAIWVFRRMNTAGLGTGLNRFNDVIIAQRMF